MSIAIVQTSAEIKTRLIYLIAKGNSKVKTLNPVGKVNSINVYTNVVAIATQS